MDFQNFTSQNKNYQPTFRYLSRHHDGGEREGMMSDVEMHHHRGEREGMISDVEMVTVCEQWNVKMTIGRWNACILAYTTAGKCNKQRLWYSISCV